MSPKSYFSDKKIIIPYRLCVLAFQTAFSPYQCPFLNVHYMKRQRMDSHFVSSFLHLEFIGDDEMDHVKCLNALVDHAWKGYKRISYSII